ncbi:ComEC/Rec2 family competence protein [Krasilnikoviella flava]|uniref:Competence protein ComEC n=1 Tax=Krasilnikoviella flava TaxID=526729 RepID=A0A1T5KWD0_9MICO|nr:ComEC/Rec2 family competence protein [Krasilnikoviella flava]SKC68076.1 competence protein ComEC [Krasilnikoviella flava]
MVPPPRRVDLRLVPAVLATWGVAWALTGAAQAWAPPVAVGAALGAVGVGVALGAVTRARRRSRHGAPALPAATPAAVPAAMPAAIAPDIRPDAPDTVPSRAPRGARGSRGARWAGGRRAVAVHAVLVLACVAAVALGVHAQAARQAPLRALSGQGAHAELVGRVASEARPAVFGTGDRWVLAVRQVAARGVAVPTAGLVEITADGPVPRFGSTVVVSGVLRPVSGGDGPLARLAASDPVAERAPPSALLRGTHTMRSALLDVTEPLSPQARGLVPGVAVGDTSRVPDTVDEAMRVTSLTHVTAVSGGHFAIVVAALTALCALARAPRTVRVVVVAAVAAAFVLLVRPEPSVLRAAWTCAAALLGLALGRPSAGAPALAAAATVLLVVDPWLARSFGFVLSCAATAGLVLLAGPLARRLTPWTGRPLAFALAVPWAAQAACGPVLLLIDPHVPLMSVPANLLATPALVPATVLGLVATLLAPWAPGLALPVAWLAGTATGWIAVVAQTFAAVPGARLPWPGGAGGVAALALLTLAGLALVLRRPPGEGWRREWREAVPRVVRRARGQVRRTTARHGRARTAAVAGLAGLALLAVVVVMVPRLAGAGHRVPADWQVAACDVGQGDSLAVRTGPESAVVVDVGPDGEAAGRCLDRLGVTTVDLLVLSHFHADHVGGLAAVLRGRAVTDALVSPLDQPEGQAASARSQLDAAGVPVHVAAAGDGGSAGSATWQVLGASGASRAGGSGGGDEGDGANDASVAVELRTAGGLDVVALGDLEEPGQEALVADLAASGRSADVDVVKMAHHGSRSQSAALARHLSPRVTLVSVGADNTYGHPTDDALSLYASVGSALVRTDECGTAALVGRGDEIGLACG